MKEVPAYGKILTLGARYTETALNGDVIVQEKVDGSLFAFGLNESFGVVMRSKGLALEFGMGGMFKKAIDHIDTIRDLISQFPPDTYFYGEYLEKPKHNTLKYDQTPKNCIVLFDGISGNQPIPREELARAATLFGVDLIPELLRGPATVEDIKALMETPSYLGGEIIEGVVIKNYAEKMLIGGQVMPLFTKFVREGFKERHETDWKVRSPKNALLDYVEGFRSEARWEKAVQYLRDRNTLLQSPRDIGELIKRVQEDIEEEEKENIKEELFRRFAPDLKRKSVAGLPEWYKNRLLENVGNQEQLAA